MNMSQILSISRSGLNAYQREMDVVSNNLANVDTLGYKDKRTTFQELLNNGTNANEVGLSQNAGNVAINAGLNVQQVNENLSQERSNRLPELMIWQLTAKDTSGSGTVQTTCT